MIFINNTRVLNMRKILVVCLIGLLGGLPMGGLQADPGLVGDWQLRVEGRRGVQTPVLSISERDGGFSGVIGGERGQVPIEQISVENGEFSFPFEMSTFMGDFKLLYKGVREGDQLSGTVETPRGKVPFTGVRK